MTPRLIMGARGKGGKMGSYKAAVMTWMYNTILIGTNIRCNNSSSLTDTDTTSRIGESENVV